MIEVRTQKELDAAIEKADGDLIVCVGGSWDGPLVVSGSATVRAYGSATVRASGSATVVAYDSATVRASGSATVMASDSATVRASGSATVVASGSATVMASDSATVQAYGSATVRAYGSATVRASGSATVVAYDSATVRASGSATVMASDSATVRASGSATVRAYDSATVTASKYVAIYQNGTDPTITGGVIIHVPDSLNTPADWLEYHGVTVTDGTCVLFKSVDDQYKAGRNGFPYQPGSIPQAPDWNPTAECGNGLHLCAFPWESASYHPNPSRYLGCPVKVTDIVVIDRSKVKVPGMCGPVFEVNSDGDPLEVS